MTLVNHTKNINSVYCSKNNKIILSGSSDCTIKVWNI